MKLEDQLVLNMQRTIHYSDIATSSLPSSCHRHHHTSFVAPASLTCSINAALARGPGPSFSSTPAASATTGGEISIAADRETGSTNRPACDTEATRARRAKLEASPVTCPKGTTLLSEKDQERPMRCLWHTSDRELWAWIKRPLSFLQLAP